MFLAADECPGFAQAILIANRNRRSEPDLTVGDFFVDDRRMTEVELDLGDPRFYPNQFVLQFLVLAVIGNIAFFIGNLDTPGQLGKPDGTELREIFFEFEFRLASAADRSS